MKKSEISEDIKSVFKDVANKLSGSERREYIGKITIEFLGSNARKAEREFGWGRETVKAGMAELTTGIRCLVIILLVATRRPRKKCLNLPMIYDH